MRILKVIESIQKKGSEKQGIIGQGRKKQVRSATAKRFFFIL